MRTIVAGLLITASIFPTLTHAYCLDDCETQSEFYAPLAPPSVDWFGGINYIEHWIRPQKSWNRLFVNSYPGFGVYLGRRLGRFLGLELGWEWTANKSRTTALARGETILEFTNTNPSPVTVNSKVRFKTGYLDLNTYIPVLDGCHCPSNSEVIFMIGVCTTRPKMHFRVNPTDSTRFIQLNNLRNTAEIPPMQQLTYVDGRMRALVRIGIGYQGFVYDNLGFRIMWRYQNNSTLRARYVQDPRFRKVWGDDKSVSLGIFTTFPSF